MAAVYKDLPEGDIRAANLLSSVGGKLRANQLDALLKNWDTYESMIQDYANGEGTAFAESQKSAESWAGRMNALSNTFRQTVGMFVNSDMVEGILAISNGFLEATNSVIQFTGAFPALITAITGFMSIKNNKGKHYAHPLKAVA